MSMNTWVILNRDFSQTNSIGKDVLSNLKNSGMIRGSRKYSRTYCDFRPCIRGIYVTSSILKPQTLEALSGDEEGGNGGRGRRTRRWRRASTRRSMKRRRPLTAPLWCLRRLAVEKGVADHVKNEFGEDYGTLCSIGTLISCFYDFHCFFDLWF